MRAFAERARYQSVSKRPRLVEALRPSRVGRLPHWRTSINHDRSVEVSLAGKALHQVGFAWPVRHRFPDLFLDRGRLGQKQLEVSHRERAFPRTDAMQEL